MPNPVLTGGEKYSELVAKKLGGTNKAPEITFEHAKSHLTTQLTALRTNIKAIPSSLKLPHEFVVCVRMHQKYSAKSYFPNTLIRTASRNEMDPIGSRNWYPGEKASPAKLIFARTTDKGLLEIENYLHSQNDFSEQFSLDVRRVENIDLLSSDEKIEGFPESWTEGYVEFVFHPFSYDKDLVIKVFQENANLEDLEIREYDSGIIFALAKTDKATISRIKEYNPLRSAHPIQADIDTILRAYSSASGPKPPIITNSPKIQVGVIDGGINPNHPYFKGVTSNEDHTTAGISDRLQIHGTWVTGMLLYGNLDQYGPDDHLPEPDFFVKSFRVLPQGVSGYSAAERNELYDVIDEIEKIIPSNPDVRVWNLSLGPKGPIYDDYITRFTYACDKLSREHDVQFCVAVGNDGKDTDPRIQSPSDSVNALSVGSYTYEGKKIVKADYSCIGPGREGNKLKPDLSALGGSDRYLLHFVSPKDLVRDVGVGYTSLATPQVTAMVSRLVGRYSLDPLSARSLLLNKTCIDNDFDIQFGHGLLPESIEDVTTCPNGSITLQYRGRLLPGKFAQLQIPWPTLRLKGNVNFDWTLVVLGQTDELSTDEYTKQSMELTFYPHDAKFNFTSPDKKCLTVNIKTQSALVEQLLSKGWTQSQFPKSVSGPHPSLGEQVLRATDMKWDNVIQDRKVIRSADYIQNPFFHLHCMSRDNEAIPVDYCLTLTIHLSQDNQDIYTPVTARFSALAPLTETIQQRLVLQSETVTT